VGFLVFYVARMSREVLGSFVNVIIGGMMKGSVLVCRFLVLVVVESSGH